jgi:hypothetical protein
MRYPDATAFRPIYTERRRANEIAIQVSLIDRALQGAYGLLDVLSQMYAHQSRALRDPDPKNKKNVFF